METDAMTDGDNSDTEQSSACHQDKDRVITDAESVLDNLLDVVRKQAEDILGAARADAESATEAARAAATAEREGVLTTARQEADDIVQAAQRSAAEQCASALAAVEAAVEELNRIDDYRSRLETLAAQLRGTVTDAEDYREVDPEALQMLAGELGEEACREVIDTFATELSIQLDDLTAAVEADDVKSKKVSRVLHNMSSGCATVGAAPLARLCNEITPETLSQHLDQIVRRGNIVRAEVMRVRDSDLAGGDPAVDVGEDAP